MQRHGKLPIGGAYAAPSGIRIAPLRTHAFASSIETGAIPAYLPRPRLLAASKARRRSSSSVITRFLDGWAAVGWALGVCGMFEEAGLACVASLGGLGSIGAWDELWDRAGLEVAVDPVLVSSSFGLKEGATEGAARVEGSLMGSDFDVDWGALAGGAPATGRCGAAGADAG